MGNSGSSARFFCLALSVLVGQGSGCRFLGLPLSLGTVGAGDADFLGAFSGGIHSPPGFHGGGVGCLRDGKSCGGAEGLSGGCLVGVGV